MSGGLGLAYLLMLIGSHPKKYHIFQYLTTVLSRQTPVKMKCLNGAMLQARPHETFYWEVSSVTSAAGLARHCHCCGR